VTERMGVVGIWGPGIFSDDVADDVREEYRELLGDDVPDEEATRQILAEYLREPGDETTVRLALAATQTGLGRLDDNVKAKALELIDSGAALTPWLEGKPSDVRARKTALERLRKRLLAPQPDRKKVRREWRPDTDLEPGDLLSYRAPNGLLVALRVVHVERGRYGAQPILELLEGRWEELPPAGDLADVPGASSQRVGGNPNVVGRRVLRWAVYPFHYGEPTWKRVGFARVGRIAPRPGDDVVSADQHRAWPILVDELDAYASAE